MYIVIIVFQNVVKHEDMVKLLTRALKEVATEVVHMFTDHVIWNTVL
jgi:hypothetical protein